MAATDYIFILNGASGLPWDRNQRKSQGWPPQVVRAQEARGGHPWAWGSFLDLASMRMSDDKRILHHVVLTTYGAWLSGEIRGFRTRHHREHVDGDYRAPPPAEDHAFIRSSSERALTQPPVELSAVWRASIGQLLQVEFQRLGAWVLILAVASQHLLVRLPPRSPRKLCGQVKRRIAIRLSASGWRGKLWGVRSKAIRIRDRAHHENTFRYIAAHRAQDAWVEEWRTEPERLDLNDC